MTQNSSATVTGTLPVILRVIGPSVWPEFVLAKKGSQVQRSIKNRPWQHVDGDKTIANLWHWFKQ